MSYLGDTLTVSLILVLLFGSIALYLYTRVQQTEQKVSLLESIVLDLKLTGELQPFHGLPEHDSASLVPIAPASPASPVSVSPISPASPSSGSVSASPMSASSPVSSLEVSSETPMAEYAPFEENVEPQEPQEPLAPLVSSPPPRSYQSMSLRELQALVRSRNLSAHPGAKKYSLIEILKQSDAAGPSHPMETPLEEVTEVKPGSMSSSLSLEPFSQDE